jgi:hypothetical protein
MIILVLTAKFSGVLRVALPGETPDAIDQPGYPRTSGLGNKPA